MGRYVLPIYLCFHEILAWEGRGGDLFENDADSGKYRISWLTAE